MNCSGFQKNVHALAAERLMDAAERANALRHAENCSSCAAALADARALTAGLKSLVVAEQEIEAPACVENALLLAYRKRAEQTPAVSSAVPLVRRTPFRPLVAIAAGLLLIFGVVFWRSIIARKTTPTKDERLGITTPTPEVKPPNPPTPVEEKPETVIATHRQRRTPGAVKPARPFVQDEITAYADDPQIASDFISIDEDQSLTPMETGQLIRVQMPRALIARFGAPVSAEKADVPVTADLLLGEDGIARAIRFVR